MLYRFDKITIKFLYNCFLVKSFFFSKRNSLSQIPCFSFCFSYYFFVFLIIFFSNKFFFIIFIFLYQFRIVKFFRFFPFYFRKRLVLLISLICFVYFIFKSFPYSFCFLLGDLYRTFVIQWLFKGFCASFVVFFQKKLSWRVL